MELSTSVAAQAYARARSAAAPDTGSAAKTTLGSLANSFEATLRSGEETAKATMLGKADPHSLVQALAETQLAVETAVTVRNKVVEAYQEILRMPV